MSSISSVTSVGYVYQPVHSTGADPLMKGLQTLASSVQSGSVSEAQSALAAFQKQLQSNPQTSGQQPFGNNHQANSAYQNLVGSIQSGNLSGAQQAVATLKTDLNAPKSSLPAAPTQISHGQTSSVQSLGNLLSISNALQSGDLTTALSALTTIQSPSFGNNSQASTDYQNLVTAVQSGNLSAAQQAYAALEADLF